MICSKCGEEFRPSPDKPGKINICMKCVENPQMRLKKAEEEERLRKERASAERKNRRRAEREAIEKATLESYQFEIVKHLKRTPHTS